jgi:glycosyltransferase involved in cell wall biosynthesis
VAAVIPTYNEADVIAHTLGYLLDDGVGVYVVDNWSTDGTPEIARRVGQQRGGLLGLERFPPEGPSPRYDLRRILGRVEELGTQLDADWLVLHDADERRRSPWPGVGLRDALFHVDECGFTCVDHITLTFWPTDGSNSHYGRRDVEQVLRYFEFSDHPGHFHQRRAWKNLGQRVSLAASAGHDVQFDGRRVYPYRFLLKHYPIRSQAHGERKVFGERVPRWNATERSFGWHAQYDQVGARSRFVRHPSELELFEPGSREVYERWLVERLSGVGVFGAPPAWATPPVWTVPAGETSAAA